MKIKDILPYLDDKAIETCLSSDAFIVPFNPYKKVFGSRTTYRTSDVNLIKEFAQLGYNVNLPTLEGTHKRELVLQKHFDLSDPVVLFIISIPINIVISILSGLVIHMVTKGKSREILVIHVQKNGEIENCYDSKGNIVSISDVSSTLKKISSAPFYTPPNYELKRPIPIHLEHTEKVVGWGEIILDKKGLLIKNATIFDETAWQLVKAGLFIGFSIGGITKKYKCSICNEDYFTCKHILGKKYDGKEAYGIIQSVDLAEISLVSDPSCVDAKIQEVNLKKINN